MKLFSRVKRADIAVLGSIASMALLSGCGGSGGADISNLSQLPDASSMVSTSGSTNASLHAAASGTAPQISTLVGDSNAALEAFWGSSLLSDLSTVDNDEEVNRFFGTIEDREGGEGACRMVETVARAFANVAEAGTSSCYMKKIPTVTSGGVTISPELSDPTTIFNQQTADRIVQVNPTGQDEGGDQHIFIKVSGSDNVTSDVYQVNLYFCNPDDDSLTGYEEIIVNRKTGLYTDVQLNSDHGEGGGRSYSSLSGKLKKSGDSLVFDTSADRTAEVRHSYSQNARSGSSKSLISISDGQLNAQLHEKNMDTDYHYCDTRDIYALASFSGTSAKNVSFSEGGFSGQESGFEEDCTTSRWDTHSFQGGVEYRESGDLAMYFNAGNTDLAQSADDSADFASSFFTSDLDTPSIDADLFDCTTTPDYTVGMDFADSNVAAVSTACEAGHFEGDSNFCWTQTLQDIHDDIQTYFQSH